MLPTTVDGTARRHVLLDCACIVAVFALPLLILRPLQDAPFIDDWVYQWSVKNLLQTGQLLIPEYSSSVNPVQVLWGALFCLPIAKFSFVATRLSTWVLGASALCSVYLLGLELGLQRKQALLGAALLGACPLFFILSFTFMTDVPFLAVSAWATYAMVGAVRRQSDRRLWAAVLLSSLAAGIRLPAVVLPAALFLALLCNAGSWGRQAWRLAAALVPMLVLLGLFMWLRHHTFVSADLSLVDSSPANRLKNLREYVLPGLPQWILESLLFGTAMGGAALLPLAAGTVQSSRRWLLQFCVTCIALLLGDLVLRALHLDVPGPLSHRSTWGLEELGATTDLLPGGSPPSTVASWVVPTIYFLSLAAGAVLLLRTFHRPAVSGEPVLRWLLIGYMLVASALWLFYDRYFLPSLPLLIVASLLATPTARFRAVVAGVALFAVLSLVGTRDHLAYSRAVWAAVHRLHDSGIPASEIDGGYMVNGWFQYGDPAQAPKNSDGRMVVPGLTDASDEFKLTYLIANTPRDDYAVVNRIPVSRWLGPDITLLVLRRQQL